MSATYTIRNSTSLKILESVFRKVKQSTEMMETLVSIIIRCYDAARYLEVVIRSTLSQDCLVQIVIIADGSTDDSAGVVQQFKLDVQLLHTSNRSVAHTRNTPIPFLAAPNTLLLDADNRLTAKAVKSLLSTIRETLACVIYGRFQCGNENRSMLLVCMTQPLKPNPFHFLSDHDFTPPDAVLFPTLYPDTKQPLSHSDPKKDLRTIKECRKARSLLVPPGNTG